MSATQGPAIRVVRDRTIRIKVIDDCGLACTFCHNEGTPVTADNKGRTLLPFVSGPGGTGRVSIYTESNGVNFLAAKMTPDLPFRRAVRTVAKAFDASEVHLTGGEPTLHTEVSSLVSALTGMGLTVGMTSNGERGRQVMPDCSAAGLNRVNVSVFGTTAEELKAVQSERFKSAGLAETKIRAAVQTIRAAVSNGVKVSVNIVVPGMAHVDRVVNLIESHGQFADVRMLTSIQDGPESIAAISEVLARVGAEPVLRTFTAGTSDERTLYRALGGRAVYVKRLLPVRLPDTCASCRFNNDTDCQEGYYGVRLYLTEQGQYMVGVCIQRMDLCVPVADLAKSGIVEEVQAFKDAEVRRLTSQYGAAA
ncbi:radical SAM protein [Streptomyces sp. TLI_171]|uniref:radical SAM protein n=1 Tax=Streptomyces sp. TLI_171 TaxID=1938859 RepID=UPI000C1921CC|nr:radical SAM protein [Streptomyces sp. TLI_171]RKE19994.1 cyclic pyranopterin phosphate synthase [Streptomyces sp. TLI_171]